MVAAHQRIAFVGILEQNSGGGTEIFSFGFASDTSADPATLAQALADGPAGQIGDVTKNIAVSVHAVCQAVTVESIDASGKVTASYRATPSGGSIRGLNTEMTQTVPCMAVTLETAAVSAKGSRVRGRFYPPAQATQPIGACVELADAQIYAAAWAGFVTACNTAGAVVAVASTTSAGLTTVTGCSADTVMDTQRRRKNHVTKQRSTTVAV